jgi:hypothetical protein
MAASAASSPSHAAAGSSGRFSSALSRAGSNGPYAPPPPAVSPSGAALPGSGGYQVRLGTFFMYTSASRMHPMTGAYRADEAAAVGEACRQKLPVSGNRQPHLLLCLPPFPPVAGLLPLAAGCSGGGARAPAARAAHLAGEAGGQATPQRPGPVVQPCFPASLLAPLRPRLHALGLQSACLPALMCPPTGWLERESSGALTDSSPPPAAG